MVGVHTLCTSGADRSADLYSKTPIIVEDLRDFACVQAVLQAITGFAGFSARLNDGRMSACNLPCTLSFSLVVATWRALAEADPDAWHSR